MSTLERTTPPTPATIFTLPDPNGIQRVFYRLPLLGYRLGFGGVMDRFRIAALTTRGRTSGKARFAALEYRQHGSKVYILSGWGEQANWVRNLEQDPQVTVRRGARVQAGLASIVRDRSEVFRALTLFYRSNPAYYERLFKRAGQRDSLDALSLPQLANRIIVVRVDPQASPTVLPPAPADAQLVTALVAGLLLTAVVLAPLTLAVRAARRGR